MFGPKLFKHLRIGAMILWVITWNALLLMGMWLGGQGFSYKSVPSRIALLVAIAGTAACALGILFAPQVQAVMLRSREDLPGLRRELWWIVVMTLLASGAVVASLATEA